MFQIMERLHLPEQTMTKHLISVLCDIMLHYGNCLSQCFGKQKEIQDIMTSNDLIFDTSFTPMSFISNVFANSSKVMFLFTHQSYMFNIRQTQHE